MLGLIGKYLNDHLKRIAHTEINYETGEKINLQPWDITIDIPSTAKHPAHQVFIRAATQEDFKAFIKKAGSDQNGVIGTLPEEVAKVKEQMYKDCIEKRSTAKEIKDKK